MIKSDSSLYGMTSANDLKSDLKNKNDFAEFFVADHWNFVYFLVSDIYFTYGL